jgi:hypothetical protein
MLNAELTKSRPQWLRTLASANVLLFIARIFVLALYIFFFTVDTRLTGEFALTAILLLTMCLFYVIGTFQLTQREHPYLRSSNRDKILAQRLLASASFACFAAGIGVQIHYILLPRSGSGILSIAVGWSGTAVSFLVFGWLLYCACVVIEYFFLAKLAARLLDGFMAEHCRIAGIGAAITSLLAVIIAPMNDFPGDLLLYIVLVAAIVLWMLFVIWTAFMNLYCAIRFRQQSRLAAERWRRQSALTVPTSRRFYAPEQIRL